MVSLLRLASNSIARSLRPAVRQISCTPSRCRGPPTPVVLTGTLRVPTSFESFSEFLEEAGPIFKKVDNKPRNWLDRKAPFPMNPTFVPPTPISDRFRQRIWSQFLEDPLENNVRALSQRFGLSMKRVDAILRLKGMESAWIEKGIPLQTGFQIGMEKALGGAYLREGRTERRDVDRADMLEQDENRDAARQRYQRAYWESVPIEGQEPVTPLSLQRAKETAERMSQHIERVKSGPKLMPRIPNTKFIQTPKEKVQVVSKDGRPDLEFVDVGGKFVDVDQRLRRISVAQRRARVKAKKAEASNTSLQ